MIRALFLLLAGCNQVYSLTPTVEIDARYFDAPIDAPFACPSLGETLAFSEHLNQMQFDCTSYTATTDRAFALCREGSSIHPATGALDGPFATIAELPSSSLETQLLSFAVSPDGRLATLRTRTSFVNATSTYRLVGTTWQHDADLIGEYTTNSSAQPRRIVYQQNGSTDDLGELVETAGAWTPQPLQPVMTLGVPSLQPIWLSADALHLLVVMNILAGDAERYLALAERASTREWFKNPRRLDLPVVFDAFITHDCARAYFSGLQSIFYAQQR